MGLHRGKENGLTAKAFQAEGWEPDLEERESGDF